jgi:6-phosphogluconolactonase (cycloisomerase 2 family)
LEAEIRVAVFSPDFFARTNSMKPSRRTAILSFLIATLALLTACGSTSSSVLPSGQSFLYVANQGSQNISAFKRDPSSGALTPLAASPFPAIVRPSFLSPTLVVDPKNLLLFVLGDNSSGGKLSVFVIDPGSGVLTPAPGSPLSLGSAAVVRSLSVDPQGDFVYVGTQGAGILGWRIDRSRRTLVPVPGSPFGDKNIPYTATVDSASKFLYTTEFTNGMETFAISPDSGALKMVNGPFYIPNNVPLAFTMHQSGKYAYVMGDANDLTLKLWVCAVNPSNGAVSAVEQETNTDPPILALSPDGKFLFSTFGTYGTPYGAPFVLTHSPDPLKPLLPTAAVVSPDSSFVYAVATGQGPGSLSVFSLDDVTGALSPIAGSPYAVGAGPTAIAITH